MLGWPQSRLSQVSLVSRRSIQHFEDSGGRLRLRTLVALADTFKRNGIEFIEADGVRWRAAAP